eukprot:TRINITY_DN5155_c0_g2_i1.p1 TRINITY_DN5155_c0_g2~~TRINITY_DN5155_c0_g2_i1.p1  ORF type:complete len:281 (-),score=51.18 TRINITY_DN5155_c0_g2_i1:82-924(-)
MEESKLKAICLKLIKTYYHIYTHDIANISNFYHSTLSACSRGNEHRIEDAIVAKGQEEISKLLAEKHVEGCSVSIKSFDYQNTQDGLIMVMVLGVLISNSSPARKFSQSFLLSIKDEDTFSIINDILRYHDEDRVSEAPTHTPTSSETSPPQPQQPASTGPSWAGKLVTPAPATPAKPATPTKPVASVPVSLYIKNLKYGIDRDSVRNSILEFNNKIQVLDVNINDGFGFIKVANSGMANALINSNNSDNGVYVADRKVYFDIAKPKPTVDGNKRGGGRR